MAKGRRIHYFPDEMDWLEARRGMPSRQLHELFCKRFGRHDVSLSNIKSLGTRRGWVKPGDGRFVKGQVAQNKGVPCAEGKGGRHPNARKTQFASGHLPHNTKYLGHERLSKDGYVEISVDQVNPHTGYSRRYVLKHRWLWEQANGPVPKGHCLKCLDGNRQNTDPGNWIAVSRSLLPRLAGRWTLGYDAAEPEIKPLILKTAQLSMKASEKKRARAK